MHKSTVFNNTAVHARLALDEVLDYFLTLFYTFVSPQLDVLFQPANQTARAQWRGGEGDRGTGEPCQSVLIFYHHTVTTRMSKINPKRCQVGKAQRRVL